MPTVRQEVAAGIAGDNPAYRVDDYPNTPAQVTPNAPYVDVYLTDLAQNGEGSLTHTLRVDCYAGRTLGAEAEDEAETIRDAVLLSLQRLDHVTWSTCQRSVFHETYIGYQITAEFTSRHVYAETIRQENTA